MAEILNELVSEEYLKEFEDKFNAESGGGAATDDTTFQYAWCLVRSRITTDVKKGVLLLEELASRKTDQAHRRDYLYTLAIGHSRLKDYTTAMKCIKNLLQSEPGNRQAQELEKAIKKNMETEAIKGAALAGGGILVAGALVGLGMALLKRK